MIGPGEPNSGNAGLGIVTQAIQQELSKHLHLTVIAPGEEQITHPKQQVGQFSEERVVRDIVKVKINRSMDSYNYNVADLEHKEGISEVQQKYKAFYEEIITAVNDYEFDVIYIHDWLGMEAGMRLQETSGKPLLIHIHSLDTDRVGAGHRSWVYSLEKEALAKADAIIAVSEYTAEKLVEHYEVTPEKIQVIYSGTTLPGKKEVKHAPLDPTVLYMGRFASQKAPLRFVDIAERVLEQRNDVHFLMVGEGDLKPEVIETVACKGLGHRLHLSENIAHKEITAVFERASILCLPSESEPFGLVAVEAAAAGIPVVLSQQSGAGEVLHKAIKVDNHDIDGFSTAIITLLDNEELRKEVINQGKKDAAQLTWAKTSESIVTLIEKLVN